MSWSGDESTLWSPGSSSSLKLSQDRDDDAGIESEGEPKRVKREFQEHSLLDPDDDEEYDVGDFGYNHFYDMQVKARKRRMKTKACTMKEWAVYHGQIMAELLEVLLHSLFYYRAILDGRHFEARKYLNGPVWYCKCPDVHLEIKQIVRQARRLFNKLRIVRVVLELTQEKIIEENPETGIKVTNEKFIEAYNIEVYPFEVVYVPEDRKTIMNLTEIMETEMKECVERIPLEGTQRFPGILDYTLNVEVVPRNPDRENYNLHRRLLPVARAMNEVFRVEVSKISAA